MNNLVEGQDFYFNEQGFVVFTASYHLQKGICCGNGCRHCPYAYENVDETKRTELLASPTPPVEGL
jgi:Family of unknown function (DUF5522)